MSKRCPITYDIIPNNQQYSKKGLVRLSGALTQLAPIPFSTNELLQEAAKRADKLSIQGVQPKLSARLSTTKQRFELVDRGGSYILKPQNPLYNQLPENEDLSMRLAKAAGIKTPLHALLCDKNGEFIYCIKRFDRKGKQKFALEDFAQLSGNNRNTKYRYSMEKLIPIIQQYTTYPAIELAEFWLRVMVNFLIGNEDMHLKNFSLLRDKQKIILAPAYDYINSTIALTNAKEEIALPLNGKKRNLTQKDLIEYLGREKCQLPEVIINKQLNKIRYASPVWRQLIDNSFLTVANQSLYHHVLDNRLKRLSVFINV